MIMANHPVLGVAVCPFCNSNNPVIACGNEGVSIADWGMTMLEWLKQPAEEVN